MFFKSIIIIIMTLFPMRKLTFPVGSLLLRMPRPGLRCGRVEHGVNDSAIFLNLSVFFIVRNGDFVSVVCNYFCLFVHVRSYQKGVRRRMGNALECRSRDFSPDYLRSRRHSRNESLEVLRSKTVQACLVRCVMFVPAC